MAQNAYKYDYGYNRNAALQPERKVSPEAKPELKVLVNPLAKQIAQEKQATALALKLSVFFAALLILFGAYCYSCVGINDAQHALESAQTDLEIHLAQNIELKTKLNALVAGVDIEKYAVEKLGLIKVTPENEVYLNANAGNKIIYSADK